MENTVKDGHNSGVEDKLCSMKLNISCSIIHRVGYSIIPESYMYSIKYAYRIEGFALNEKVIMLRRSEIQCRYVFTSPSIGTFF